MKLRRNMCVLDRFIRGGLGAALIYVGFVDTDLIPNQLANLILGLVGLVNVVVSLIGTCPVYRLANISTYRDVQG